MMKQLTNFWRSGPLAKFLIGCNITFATLFICVLCAVVFNGIGSKEQPVAQVPTATVATIAKPVPTKTKLPSVTPSHTNTPAPVAASATPTKRPEPTAQLTALTPAQVIRVVDGDTIVVLIKDQKYKLRYIGMNTPETVAPGRPIEWMGPQASAANKALVEGKTVYLEKDVSETDKYGRLLRYVYLADGTFVNLELVRQGYAQVSTYPPDVRYQDLFLKAQREAKKAGKGLWSATPTVTAGSPVAPTPSSPPPPSSASPTIVIVTVNKVAEYVDIRNTGNAPQKLSGWHLLSERGSQDCPLGGTIQPGQTLRIWAMSKDIGKGGYNCNYGRNIWNNSKSDPAVLYDDAGREIDRQ